MKIEEKKTRNANPMFHELFILLLVLVILFLLARNFDEDPRIQRWRELDNLL